LLIGSRFHSLVGALSQSTPSIAVGWRHTNDMLMSDFGCPDMILSPTAGTDLLEDLVRRCIDQRASIVETLSGARLRMLTQLENMWAHVDGLLGVAR